MPYRAHELYFPADHAAVDQDWDAAPAEDGDETTWHFWEHAADEHARRGGHYVYSSEESAFFRVNVSTGRVDTDASDFSDVPEGPMMNFYWPLGVYPRHTPEEMAWLVRDFNVCIVRVGDEYGIALTGGGMDLSWHLAAAAVAVGYTPWRELSVSQGSPESTWRYGVSEIGRPWAQRVKLAIRYRIKTEIQLAKRHLTTLADWK